MLLNLLLLSLGNIDVTTREIQNGGQDLFGFGAGLSLNETTGILSADTPTVRIVGTETANIGSVDFTIGNEFTFGITQEADAGVNANTIISALFMNRPGAPNSPFTATALDQNVFVRYQDAGGNCRCNETCSSWNSYYI